MNYSDTWKCVWWGPMRTGSRAVSTVLGHLGFVNAVTGKPLGKTAHSHELRFPAGREDYALVCSVRNPYMRMQSLYTHLRRQPPDRATFPEFPDWLDRTIADHRPEVFFDDLMRVPGEVIRLERLAGDLLRLPMVRQAPASMRPDWERFIEHNGYADQHEDGPAYTPALADLVLVAFRRQFDWFGYERESWR